MRDRLIKNYKAAAATLRDAAQLAKEFAGAVRNDISRQYTARRERIRQHLNPEQPKDAYIEKPIDGYWYCAPDRPPASTMDAARAAPKNRT